MLVWKIFRKCIGPSFSDNYLPNGLTDHTKNADDIFKLRGKLKEVSAPSLEPLLRANIKRGGEARACFKKYFNY